MRHAKFKTSMESRTGSVSSGLESSSGVRRQALKTSPFSPHSSGKLTQSIIKDHMVSHYKKIYSAKAAIDTSVPKSLLQSVKYNDQIRKEQQKKGVRPRSAFDVSHRNSRTSCFSAEYDDSPYLCSRSSIISTSRFNSSFNVKDIVYPSCSVNSHYSRPSSERRYRDPDAAFQRKDSTCSLVAPRDQGFYKTFQDPVKKTYSGDLLDKHSQHFTREKPFTPKTLKSDKSSYLSKYRFYRAPQIKPSQDSKSRLLGGETVCKSTNHKEYTEKLDKPSQECSTEHDWSEDEVTGTYSLPLRLQKHKIKSREHYFLGSSSRVSPEGGKSPVRSLISAEEEELLYLEFISAVTEDILSRGHISDRMLDRVMNRHIDMNLHQLDEGKMRHLLEVLRNEFEDPSNISTSSEDPPKNGKAFLYSIISHFESGTKPVKTKEDKDIITHASMINHCDLSDRDNILQVSTSSCSSVRTASSTKKREKNKKTKHYEGVTMCSDDVTDTIITNQGDIHQIDMTAVNVQNEHYEHTTMSSDGYQGDGPSKEVEDLGDILSESLHVSNKTDSEIVATADANQHDDVSDDDF